MEVPRSNLTSWHDRLGKALEYVYEIDSDPTEAAGFILVDLINEIDELAGIAENRDRKAKNG